MPCFPCLNIKPSHKKVWEKTFGNRDFVKCPVCQINYIDKNKKFVDKKRSDLILYGHWKRCRKLSKPNGGSNHLNNFTPVCISCRDNIGCNNIDDFLPKN